MFTTSPGSPDAEVARPEGLPYETVPDWNNIGLFTAGIAVGALLGATVALLVAPASGEQIRGRIARRFRGRDDDSAWDELAAELARAGAEAEKERETEDDD